MKFFNPFRPPFILMAFFLILSGCEKKTINPMDDSNKGEKYFYLNSNDSIKFSYHFGDTLTFYKYKSTTQEKLVFKVKSINIDTFYHKHYFNDYKSWFEFYEECFHINFTNLTNDSLQLDLYQLGKNSTGYHGYSLYVIFNNTFYKAINKTSYDSLTINNFTYQSVITSMSAEMGDIPKNSHILLNYKEGIFRIRPSNDEIWDLEKR